MSMKYHKKVNNLKLCDYCYERLGRIGYNIILEIDYGITTTNHCLYYLYIIIFNIIAMMRKAIEQRASFAQKLSWLRTNGKKNRFLHYDINNNRSQSSA